MQDDVTRTTPGSGHPSRTPSRNALGENFDSMGSAEAELAQLRKGLASADNFEMGSKVQSSSAVQRVNTPPASYSYAAALGTSLSRSTTPDPQHIARAPSPCLTPIGEGRGTSEKRSTSSNSFHGISSHIREPSDLVAAISGMNLSNGVKNADNYAQIEETVNDQDKYTFDMPGGQNNVRHQTYINKSESTHLHGYPEPAELSYSKSSGNGHGIRNTSLQADMQSNSYPKGSSGSIPNSGGGLLSHYQQIDGANLSYPNYGLSGFPMMSGHPGNVTMPPLFENAAVASAMAVPLMDSRMMGGNYATESNFNYDALESQNLGRIRNQMTNSALQAPFVDPGYRQYLRTAEYAAVHNNPAMDMNYMGNAYVDLLQKAYLGSLLSPQKSQYGISLGGKASASNLHGFYGNPALGVGLSYPGSPLAGPLIPNSPVGPVSPMRHGDVNMRFSPGTGHLAAGGIMGPWHLNTGGVENTFASSLLEEFKSNKARSFELSEITGHVVEFR